MSNTRKITFDCLAVEITRRCQLQCSHCMRGDAQDIDMAPDVMESLLKQTEYISELSFTGGEPLLNLEGIKHFLQVMKGYGVGLGQLRIITNGLIRTDEIMSVLEDYYGWIAKTTKDSLAPYNKNNDFPVTLDVSGDSFHRLAGAKPKEAIKYYQQRQKCEGIRIGCWDIADLSLNDKGRAKTNQLVKHPIKRPDDRPHKIEVLTRNNPTYCPFRYDTKLYDEKTIKILCPIYITALGRVGVGGAFHNGEYEYMDDPSNSICEVSKNILGCIRAYNRKVKGACVVDTVIDQMAVRASDILADMYKSQQYLKNREEYPDANGVTWTPNEVLRGINYGEPDAKTMRVFWQYIKGTGMSKEKVKKELDSLRDPTLTMARKVMRMITQSVSTQDRKR